MKNSFFIIFLFSFLFLINLGVGPLPGFLNNQKPINVLDYPYNVDNTGVTDCSDAFIAAFSAAASFSTIDTQGFYSGMPSIYVPAGTYLITQKNIDSIFSTTYSNLFFSGLNFYGDGPQSTKIIFKRNQPNDSQNYLMTFSNVRDVVWKNMSIYAYDGTQANGGEKLCLITGSGSAGCQMKFENLVTYLFKEHFTVTGTELGSELYWDHCWANNSYDSTWFMTTNVQAGNLNFIHNIVEGGGIIYDYLAGGNSVFTECFSSMFGPGTVFNFNAGGASIGTNNDEYLLNNCNIEVDTTGVTYINDNSIAKLTLNNCLMPSGTGSYPVIVGGATLPANVLLNNCFVGPSVVFKICSNSVCKFNMCQMPPLNLFATPVPDAGSHFYSPTIITEHCTNTTAVNVPIDVDYNYYLTSGPPITTIPASKKSFIYYQTPSSVVGSNGLPFGDGSYQPTTFTLPIGCRVSNVDLFFNGGPSGSASATFNYLITNSNGSITFNGPTTDLGNATSIVHAGTSPLYYVPTNSTQAELILDGQANTTAGYANGYLNVEYY